jgi:hypothetical protein
MPRTLYHALFIEHRRLVKERKGDTRWNITVDEYRRILRKGCFVCGYRFSRDTQNDFYPHRINNQDYDSNNTVALCRLCSRMCRSKDPVTLLKQLIHIGSRYMNTTNIEYLDSHRNNTSIESYDKFLAYLTDEKAIITLDEETYGNMCVDDCMFCGRLDSKINHNVVRLKLDELYPGFITTCTSCYALYRCFKGLKEYDVSNHDAFLTYAMMCVDRNNIVENNMKDKFVVRNETLYMNHSHHSERITYVPGNVRFDNIRNGLWNILTSSNVNEPFLEVKHEKWSNTAQYKTESVLISRADQIIDSFLLTPYRTTTDIKYVDQFTSLASGADIIRFIETDIFPAQFGCDSKIQIGVRHRNARIRILIDHDGETSMRLRFYSDARSVEMCECKSNTCDKCIQLEMTRTKKLDASLEIVYIIDLENRVKLATSFIRTIQKYTYSDDIEIDIKKKSSESPDDLEKRVNKLIKIEKRNLAIIKEGEDNFRRKNNDYLKKWRQSQGVKERVKGSQPQLAYNTSFKDKQIEKYGEEIFKKINALKVKICRLKKKEGVEDEIQELQAELNRLIII